MLRSLNDAEFTRMFQRAMQRFSSSANERPKFNIFWPNNQTYLQYLKIIKTDEKKTEQPLSESIYKMTNTGNNQKLHKKLVKCRPI